MGIPRQCSSKKPACLCRRHKRCRSEIQVWSLGGGNGNPFQYSCLENSIDRRAWWATVYGVAKSWTWLSTHTHMRAHTHTHTHTPYIHLITASLSMDPTADLELIFSPKSSEQGPRGSPMHLGTRQDPYMPELLVTGPPTADPTVNYMTLIPNNKVCSLCLGILSGKKLTRT